MVLMVVNTVWILNLLHTLLMSSLTPTMKGRRMIYLGGSSSIAFLLSLAALWITWLGYLLDLRTIFRCSSSFWRFFEAGSVEAFGRRHTDITYNNTSHQPLGALSENYLLYLSGGVLPADWRSSHGVPSVTGGGKYLHGDVSTENCTSCT